VEKLSNGQIIDLALSMGFDKCEVYKVESENLNISVCHQNLELLNRENETGVAVRFWKGSRVGFGFKDNVFKDSIIKMIRDVSDIISRLPEEKNIEPAPGLKSLDVYKKGTKENPFFDHEIKSCSMDAKIKKVMAVEKAAFDFSDMIKVSRVSSYEEKITRHAINNSNGLDVEYATTKWRGMYIVIGGKGENRQMKTSEVGGIFFDDFDPVSLGQEAARKVIISAGGEGLKSEEMTVLIHSRAANQIFSRLSNGFIGDLVDRNMSVFKDKLGEKIAPEFLNIVDDPLMPGGYQSTPYDDEGIATRKVTVVRNGVLKSYLYSLQSAEKNGTMPTGSSRRAHYGSLPMASLSNLYVENGSADPKDMISSIKYGFYLYNPLDVRGINLVSGDFSINGDGVLIENGRITRPISTITIGSNVFDFLSNIECIGNDLAFEPIHPFFGGGNVGSPTILVKNLVAGSI